MSNKQESKYKFDFEKNKIEISEGKCPALDVLTGDELILQVGLNIPHSKHSPYFNELVGNRRNDFFDKTKIAKIFNILYPIFEEDSSISTFNWNKLNEYQISFRDYGLEKKLLDESVFFKLRRLKKLLNSFEKNQKKIVSYISENPLDYHLLLSLLSTQNQQVNSQSMDIFTYNLKFHIERGGGLREGEIKYLENIQDEFKRNPQRPLKGYPLLSAFSDIWKMKTTLHQRGNSRYDEDISTFKFTEPVRRYRKRQIKIQLT